MKIAMILDSPFPPDPRVENQAQALINDGHTIDLYCLSYDGNDVHEEIINGINVYRFKASRFMYSMAALAYSIPLYHHLLKKILKRRFIPNLYDAVHIHDMQSARAVFDLLQASNYKGKVIQDLHEMRPEIMKLYPHVVNWPGKWLISPKKWKRFERKFIKKADKVVVVTKSATDYYVENFDVNRGKFVTVPNSVKQSFYKDISFEDDIIKLSEGKFTLLYVGETGFRRGILEVLKSVNVLRNKISNIQFICVGKSKSDADWKAYVENNGLEGYVKLVGWQDFTLFPSYIKASDVCLSPLHRNIHHDTTFANKLFQYMSISKPVVVSDCTAQKEVVLQSECGLVHEAENAESLSEAIFKLYKDPSLRSKMGKNGRNAVIEKYNWENVSQDLKDMYRELSND